VWDLKSAAACRTTRTFGSCWCTGFPVRCPPRWRSSGRIVVLGRALGPPHLGPGLPRAASEAAAREPARFGSKPRPGPAPGPTRNTVLPLRTAARPEPPHRRVRGASVRTDRPVRPGRPREGVARPRGAQQQIDESLQRLRIGWQSLQRGRYRRSASAVFPCASASAPRAVSTSGRPSTARERARAGPRRRQCAAASDQGRWPQGTQSDRPRGDRPRSPPGSGDRTRSALRPLSERRVGARQPERSMLVERFGTNERLQLAERAPVVALPKQDLPEVDARQRAGGLRPRDVPSARSRSISALAIRASIDGPPSIPSCGRRSQLVSAERRALVQDPGRAGPACQRPPGDLPARAARAARRAA